MAVSALHLLLLDLCFLLSFSVYCSTLRQGRLCNSTCFDVRLGQRHSYRYSTVISNSWKASSPRGAQLALDCVVDIDVKPGCQDRILKLRSIKIKQSSSKRNNSAHHLRNIREALEKNPLQFRLDGGKVTALCPQETEQTDVYGTCMSSYEQRGPSLLKIRNLHQCFGDRMNRFWRTSTPMKEGKTMSAGLMCSQLYEEAVLKKVNCTETVSLVPLGNLLEATETKTISSLTLLRTLEVTPQSELLLNLVVQVRSLSSHQLRELWHEASFKCRDDWQPLVDALSACGTEDCISVATDLIVNKEVDKEQIQPLLNTISFTSNPSPSMISHLGGLLKIPEIHHKVLVLVSSLVYGVCRVEGSRCIEISEVQQFVHVLKQNLGAGCDAQDRLQISELLHVLKAVENAGPVVADLLETLSNCVQSHTVPLELRLAAIRAFSRIPCHHPRRALVQTFQKQEEDVEVRIAAYQQLMLCPKQEIFSIVKTMLSNEKSTQVGSFVWSHLFNIQKTEDPLKQPLMEALPDDILSQDFEGEPWKYSSHMDHTVDGGVAAANIEGAVKMFEEQNPANSVRQNERQSDGCPSPALASFRKKQKEEEKRDRAFQCWINVKMFGKDLTFFTCDDLHVLQRKLSLNTAGVIIKLLKGQEIKLSQRPVILAEELVLPSLSGLPMRLSVNMSTLFSITLKGISNYKSWSHFSLAGYIKPNALVSISVRSGVDGAMGSMALEWISQLKTSSSLDGAVHLHNGQNLKLVLNTPEDFINILTFSTRAFHIIGDGKEEVLLSRNLKEKSTCSPKTLSKMVGWQLCSQLSYPLTLLGKHSPMLVPVSFSLRLQKLDKGLKQYLLEAAYTYVPQTKFWIPLEARLLLFLGTPQSTIARDVSLDINLSPKRLFLKITHPLKSILIQAQLEDLNNHHSGRIELLLDNIHHYFIKGHQKTVNLATETRNHFHLDAKVAADGHPFSLSVNSTYARRRKLMLERSLDDDWRHYSADAAFTLPSMFGVRVLGLLKQQGSEWSSAVSMRYGTLEDSQKMQECHMVQNLQSLSDSTQMYSVTAAHELHCTQFININHKVHLRHEKSPFHVQSSLDVSYGKQWNQSSNKHRILFNQSLKNQSEPGLTSYTLELSLRLPDKGLNYRSQLLHSYFKTSKSESSTHLKINYNNQMPLILGVHWKDVSTKTSLRKWEGSFNMDTPWLYVYLAQKLAQPHRGITQFSFEVTTRKLVNLRSVILEGFYKRRSKERQAQLHLFTPTTSYIKVGGWSKVGKRGVKASCSISTVWTPALHGQISVGNGKHLKTLELNAGYGKQDLNISAVLSILDKKLKTNVLMMTMTLADVKNPYAELQIEGTIEEIRKDQRVYQKRWKLHFRQPFTFIPQSLILQETFTSDLHQKEYTLESKILVNGNKKGIHVLTLGFQPQQPFVCSSVIQSFNTETIPQNSKICLSSQTKQNVHEIRCRLWSGNQEALEAFGELQLHESGSSHEGITIKANLSQRFQMDFPNSVSLDIDALKSGHEYHSEGKVSIDNRNYHALIEIRESQVGKINCSMSLKAHEKNVTIHLNIENDNYSSVSMHADFCQTFLPELTDAGHIRLAANYSDESIFLQCMLKKDDETLSAHLRGSLTHHPLRMALSGDLVCSISELSLLPNSSSLFGVLSQSQGAIEGELTVIVDDAVYGLELSHQQQRTSGEDLASLLCVDVLDESLCMNISTTSTQHGYTSLGQASHPLQSTVGLHINSSHSDQCSRLELLAQTVQNTYYSEVNYLKGKESEHLNTRTNGSRLHKEDSVKLGIRAIVSDSQTASFTLELQCHHNTSSAGLMVIIAHNTSALHPYLPPMISSTSQWSRSESSLRTAAKLLLGDSSLAAEAEILREDSGFRQELDFHHSMPQLHMLPWNLTVSTSYGGNKESLSFNHRTLWDSEASSSLSEDLHSSSRAGTGWHLNLKLVNGSQAKLGDMNLDWSLFGSHAQVTAQGSWTLVKKQEEKQPIISTLTQFNLHASSNHSSDTEGGVSRSIRKPFNVSLSISEQWQEASSRGQACLFLSPGQIQGLLFLVEMGGCFAVAHEGTGYSQNSELKWKDKRLTQSMKYQGGSKGVHTLLVELGALNVSPSPCPSHFLITQIQSNLRDHLEHHVEIGLCPPHPALIWSGSHRVNAGKEMLHTQTHVSVSGQPQNCSFSLSLRNSSSSQRTNYSLLTEWQVGNWRVELASGSMFSGRNGMIQAHAKLDGSEMLWLQGALGKRCLEAAAGHQAEVTEWPLSLTHRAQMVLQRSPILWKTWSMGSLRYTLRHSIFDTLQLLQFLSQQVQHELKKPLATLAGAYHDVTGQHLDSVWQEVLQIWTRELTELLPRILHDPQMRAPSLTALQVSTFAVDMGIQQSFQWIEARLAAMLVGVRRQLALIYKFSESECELVIRLPLPVGPWLKVKETGVTEVFLEELVLKPMLALNSVSPTAELYRLKKKIIESPANYQALLVTDVYVVTFDGHLFKLPASCDFTLAADVKENSFSIVLKSYSFKRRSLVVQLQTTKIVIHPNGEVEDDCHLLTLPYTSPEVTVRKDGEMLVVSNLRGLLVSCATNLEVCSLTLDVWLHGASTGLLGTNDNEAANELLLPDGTHPSSMLQFTRSWQVDSECNSRESEICLNDTADSLSCSLLFSSANSPLSPCFRVVEPLQFLLKCESLECVRDVPRPGFCSLASAYIHLCHRNYVPLELPVSCGQCSLP
ncbi:hypothetical protein DNTS_015852 [Danionella cerebrum]|uniref:Vitellogenin domain-containing protein n=1 Tax=Danionella cerebrum TaxID=2873325 RepID=A0A553Q6D2_9TELE|nr:hypothetical protein DNTS_015852 [Danionella translucida]